MPPRGSGCKRTGVELDSMTARIAASFIRTPRYSRRALRKRACLIISSTRLSATCRLAITACMTRRTNAISPAPSMTTSSQSHSTSCARRRHALITALHDDKQDSTIRDYLAERADLLGRYASKHSVQANAGTSVTTDILFLQKRTPGKALPARHAATRSIHTPMVKSRLMNIRKAPADDAGEMRLEARCTGPGAHTCRHPHACPPRAGRHKTSEGAYVQGTKAGPRNLSGADRYIGR